MVSQWLDKALVFNAFTARSMWRLLPKFHGCKIGSPHLTIDPKPKTMNLGGEHTQAISPSNVRASPKTKAWRISTWSKLRWTTEFLATESEHRSRTQLSDKTHRPNCPAEPHLGFSPDGSAEVYIDSCSSCEGWHWHSIWAWHSIEPYRHVSQKPNDNWQSEDCKGGGVRNTSSKERTGQTCLIKQDQSHAPERNHMQTIAEKHSLKDTSWRVAVVKRHPWKTLVWKHSLNNTSTEMVPWLTLMEIFSLKDTWDKTSGTFLQRQFLRDTSGETVLRGRYLRDTPWLTLLETHSLTDSSGQTVLEWHFLKKDSK